MCSPPLQRVCDLSACGMFVMDEADKLLSPEFVPLIDRLLSFTPSTRQILCFSATFPKTVVSFRDQWCPGAHEINLMEELTLKGVTQFYAFVDERQKVHCIAEGSLVALADGSSVPIECVQVGAEVLSYHAALAPGEKEGLAVRRVDAVFDNGWRECVELLFEDGRTLVCTPDHRIRTADGRWVAAGKLLLGADEVAVRVDSVDEAVHGAHRHRRQLRLSRARLVDRRDVGAKKVFDLSVPSDQGPDTCSFVANGVVAHNCLQTLFTKLDINQCIIFCNSVTRVELLAKKITELGSSCQRTPAATHHRRTAGATSHCLALPHLFSYRLALWWCQASTSTRRCVRTIATGCSTTSARARAATWCRPTCSRAASTSSL